MSTRTETAPLGRPIQGPSALGDDLRRLGHLTVRLALTDFKLRFFGSMLGYLWQLVRPLLLFGVLFVVFTEFVKLGGDTPHYAVVLLTGLVVYQFFSDATSRSVLSVVDNESLVRKVQFPRLAIPASTVVEASFNLGLNFLAVLVFYLATGVEPRWEWLLIPVYLLPIAALVMGTAMLLSALYVRFRDIKPIWEVVLQALFYATPILYPIEIVPSAQLQHLLMMNPIAAVLEQMRHDLIDPTAPTAAQAIGGAWRLVIPALIVVFAVALGFWVFNREAPRIAEEL